MHRYVTNLFREECAMIRKELSFALKDFTMFFEIELLCNFILNLQKDTNDSIRIYLMDTIVSLKLNPDIERAYEFISNTIIALSNDESWRVRLTVADKVNEILTFPNLPEYLKKNVIDIFSTLITDNEAEARNKTK